MVLPTLTTIQINTVNTGKGFMRVRVFLLVLFFVLQVEAERQIRQVEHTIPLN